MGGGSCGHSRRHRARNDPSEPATSKAATSGRGLSSKNRRVHCATSLYDHHADEETAGAIAVARIGLSACLHVLAWARVLSILSAGRLVKVELAADTSEQ